jgi:7,8-dihydropterin-6-yl-methyl-4-(beta-D-ribofuranosyl)aminobenzene 5'-phosphate synthase
LHPADEERFKKTIDALKKFDIKHIGTSHCTGSQKEAVLYMEFKDRFFFAPVGTDLIIDDVT